ncbi:hypothetical protein CR970_00920 [Candidatus Saccharibacteria bacterium]|nr:MAG: hypothetical protein CR970_00920 [Candidatus Saccharibacteria bacterium]
MVGAGAYAIYYDLQRSDFTPVESQSRVVGQAVGAERNDKVKIDEPSFTMYLPGDWEEVNRVQREGLITWRSTIEGQDARSLTIFVDNIPEKMPVNRIMPVTVNETSLVPGDVSDNCTTFTGEGEDADASTQTTAHGRWSGVDFICHMKGIDNQVGVGAPGAINQVVMRGSDGEHRYFFLYIERNIQPNYVILSDILRSFRVK